ncbi:MAG: glycosyltransferase family 9 protein [Acetobacteraceae bacterium]|nr:glycosyltransferase family 9 protein [Acetobacteraceae bacterium]
MTVRKRRAAPRPTRAATDPTAAGAAIEMPAAQPVKPAILIDIDPNISGGFIHGRFDLIIRGRIAAEEPIEEATLLVGETLVSRTQFGEPERAAPVTLPNGAMGHQRAFQFSVPLLQDTAQGPCRCVITARTGETQTHSEAFDLSVEPADSPPITLVSGPSQLVHADDGVHPPIVLYVERAGIDGDGLLSLHGWAVAFTRVITIQVFVDETRIAAAKTGIERDDVGNIYPSYPNNRRSGFSLTTPLGDTVRDAGTVRVQAICLSGFSCEVVVPVERIRSAATPSPPNPGQAPFGQPSLARSFGAAASQQAYQLNAGFLLAANAMPNLVSAAPPASAEPLVDPRRVINCFCDDASVASDGTLVVVGWAVCAVGIGAIRVYLDDKFLGEAATGFPRPDVGEEFAAIPMARLAGYRFEQRLTERSEGEHSVRVVVHNGLDDAREEALAVRIDHIEAPTEGPAAEPPPASDVPEFRFELDSPQVADGVVADPITGRLTIEGWVLARSGIAGMEVFLDDQRLGEAHYGLARQDVGAAFPDWDNALRSGYAFHCPPRVLRDGAHAVQLTVRANNGREHVVRFAIEVRKAEDQDELANIRRRVARVETDLIDSLLTDLNCRPAFHLVLRQTGTLAVERLTTTLDTLRGQVYRDWRLSILADAADASTVRGLISAWDEDLAPRIAVIGADDPAWDAPLVPGADTRTLCGLLCPGDELGADALAEIALAAGLYPGADVIYGDEVRISPASHEREPFFKPDWSPDLLLSTNYIGRPWFAAGALIQGLGATPRSLTSDGEYDLVLRATERATSIRHVPKLLAQRGAMALDGDTDEAAALARATARRGTPAQILPGWGAGTWRAKRPVTVSGKVSIIIPTCAAKGYIETCLNTLRERTAYRNIEIVAIDNIPDSEMGWKIWLQQNADLVVDIPDAFNWSRFNNTAVAACDGEFLLFLNDDIEVVQDDWLDVMLEHMTRPEVAIVGPQLLYPDRKVQHAGMFLANNGIGRHAFRFAAQDEPGYFGLALTQRNVMAVTGACMLVRRDVFDRLGRFDELHTIVNNDLDFCLRAHKAGLLTVFTPYATLIHHELASRDKLKDVFDLSHFDAHWKTLFAAGDPYFSPRLSRHSDDYRPDDEPLQTVFSGHPLFRPQDVQRILVVKLDHIGDFVTALPAIRRLKQIFPHAHLTVLAGRASEAFTALEPSIDALIPFDFFHARSQLGERDLTRDDFLALQAQLAPYRFDLAVDLRKHLSTRDVLKYTGARFLAGFDYMGQFPFLDIALEWDGDKTLQRKRGHVVDDLLALVEAVATATSGDRTLIQPVPPRTAVEDLPEAIRPLFAKPVVAVHAGAGNITKQWPEAHFTALIDLLVERNGVNVLLVGGPDDEAVSDAIVANVLQPGAIASMAGQTRLAALPQLLSACVMYIGNDSGPKHIAAAMGLPTIGIHSGVVDATEWGPMGERSVALRRNMTCSPCYLANAADCPRNLACLRLLEPALVYQTAQTLLARPHAQAPASATPNATETILPEGTVPEPDDTVAPEPDAATATRAARPGAPGGKPRTPKPTARPRRGAPRARVPA